MITPNDVLPTVAIRPGWPRFAWLNRLNTSTRSCSARAALQLDVLDDRQVRVAESRADDRVAPQVAEVERRRSAETGSAKTDDDVHDPAPGAMRGSQTLLLNH